MKLANAKNMNAKRKADSISKVTRNKLVKNEASQ